MTLRSRHEDIAVLRNTSIMLLFSAKDTEAAGSLKLWLPNIAHRNKRILKL